jgi:hypothetical protein
VFSCYDSRELKRGFLRHVMIPSDQEICSSDVSRQMNLTPRAR